MKNSSEKSGVKSLYRIASVLWIIAIIATIIPIADLIGAITDSNDNTLDYAPVTVLNKQLNLPNTAELSDFSIHRIKAEATFPVVEKTVIYYDHGLKLVYYLITIAIFYYIRQIVGSLRDGTPFTSMNAQRLRILPILIVGGMLFKVVAYYLLSLMLDEQLATIGLSLDVSSAYESSPLIIVLILGVLSEVFRQGVKLQEEQTLTI